MIICAKCAKEMHCTQTGVYVHYGDGHVYASDRYACEGCEAEVVHTNPVPFHMTEEGLGRADAAGKLLTMAD